jgi:hypothetical protein
MPDSQRARLRLCSVFKKLSSVDTRDKVGDIVLEEQGFPLRINISYTDGKGYDFDDFFQTAPIRDVLDVIAVIFEAFLAASCAPNLHVLWISAAERIFNEEHMSYRVDAGGVVHPFVDVEFETNRASAIEALNSQQFGEASAGVEAAFRHLRDGHGREALRMMFPAVEVAAKVLFPRAFARLMPNEVDRHIVPRMQTRYADKQPAIDASKQLLEGMKAWIKAAQPYRHGQEQKEPAEPPIDFVVAHLSAGATYLRWMIELCSDQGTG